MTVGHRIQSDLFTAGWTEIAGVHDDKSLVELAGCMGEILPDHAGNVVAKLTPTLVGQAASRSFSYHYGHGEFPLHTDTAFWPMPARYVLLRSERSSATATLLLSSESVDGAFGLSSARRAIFAVRTTKATVYSAPFLQPPHIGVRFDPCYMKPANATAMALVDAVRQAATKAHEFFWTGANALVIDNWRCLHGRRYIEDGDIGRCLSRIYVGETKQ
jgi:hypothetical protein